eukprot:364656-Chlamydomonas_euryale.AAC.2
MLHRLCTDAAPWTEQLLASANRKDKKVHPKKFNRVAASGSLRHLAHLAIRAGCAPWNAPAGHAGRATRCAAAICQVVLHAASIF